VILWLVRLVMAYLVLRGISRLVGGIYEGLYGPRENRPRGSRPPSVPLARDPICGTYVVPSRALTAGSGAGVRFFCSDACRRAYVAKRAS
jgi:YHS domain-containing protein